MIPPADTLWAAILDLCRLAHIPLAGAAPAAPVPAADQFYETWLQRGFHAGMTWLERHRSARSNPAGLLPGARSVLVCAFPLPPSVDPPPAPRISRFYRGEDYHRRIRRDLNFLLEGVQQRWPEVRGRVCVDAEPLPERALGRLGGLGWVGRNGCLIHPRWGSFFNLGEIVLNVDLPRFTPLENACGDCDRCRQACPTGALQAGGAVDCRRCVAFHTVENRNLIPGELAGKLGGRIFGCDGCQAACPYNAAPSADAPPAAATLATGRLPASPPPPAAAPATRFGTDPGLPHANAAGGGRPFAAQASANDGGRVAGAPAAPSNREAEEGIQEFASGTLSPSRLLDLSGKAFARRYALTAAARTGRRGLLKTLAALAAEGSVQLDREQKDRLRGSDPLLDLQWRTFER